MTIDKRIEMLRKLMREKGIDAYIIPSSDNHQSEYVGDHFRSREFITGFTGSAGTAVITPSEAGLWTDGRYFIQAGKELAGSCVTLFKAGNEGVPTIEEYLEKNLPNEGTLGFDGRVISAEKGKLYERVLAAKHIKIQSGYDLIDQIWDGRPPLSDRPLYMLSEKYTGESSSQKLNRLREAMKDVGATCHLLITLDDIAWLLNIRGDDVLYTPVVLSYAVIMTDCVHLFIDEKKISEEVKAAFSRDNIILHPYNDVYDFVAALPLEEVVLVDPQRVNYALSQSIPSKITRVERTNPTIPMKALKNEIEVENIKKAHIKDGVAHTKFMYWIKNTIEKELITELSASAKLEELRNEQEHFISPSFGPICAYGSNAAMCHYSSSEETNCTLEEGGLFLTDTGGHYLEGTTDITRTLAIGKVSQTLKMDFTNVLRGNLALANAIFPYGCTGQNLDALARQYLWESMQDYNHGTGHGVGYLLSVHEPGRRLNYKYSDEAALPLEEGIVITDEPGLYVENSHGIRLENELLVKEAGDSSFGKFMKFEVITYVPFDLDAIEEDLLTSTEKKLLNDYHKIVYDTVSPYLNEKEKEWLKDYTRAI